MGLLSEGSLMSWAAIEPIVDHLRSRAVKQFINVYKKFGGERADEPLWGDEVEYMIVKLDDETRTARLSLRATEVLSELQRTDTHPSSGTNTPRANWMPEYGSYMLESSPGAPYGALMTSLTVVEDSMKFRRKTLQEALLRKECVLTMSTFPRCGCAGFTDPPFSPTPDHGLCQSLFVPDEVTQTTATSRYKFIEQNMRDRRGEKLASNIPIFKDKQTPTPFVEDLGAYGDNDADQQEAKPGHIYTDTLGIGFGSCGLQATFQASCLEEAKLLHDNLVVLCPIMVALSAATPLYRGYLTELDTRHLAMSQLVDNRTQEERGTKAPQKDKFIVRKPNWDSTDTFLSYTDYNDVKLTYDPNVYNTLIDGGVDESMSRWVAYMFTRDPIILHKEHIDHKDDTTNTDILEGFLNGSYNFVKLKVPSFGDLATWRLEFRPLEAQLTDFENAALVVFVALMVRTVAVLGANLLVPISRVDENLRRSHSRDAVTKETFFFRKSVLQEDKSGNEGISATQRDQRSEYGEMSLDEIVNGSTDFIGLIPLIYRYVDLEKPDVSTLSAIRRYLDFISQRATGKMKTNARWIRDFIASHPAYMHDSKIPEEVNFDLITACARISSGNDKNPDFLPGTDSKNRSTGFLKLCPLV